MVRIVVPVCALRIRIRPSRSPAAIFAPSGDHVTLSVQVLVETRTGAGGPGVVGGTVWTVGADVGKEAETTGAVVVGVEREVGAEFVEGGVNRPDLDGAADVATGTGADE